MSTTNQPLGPTSSKHQAGAMNLKTPAALLLAVALGFGLSACAVSDGSTAIAASDASDTVSTAKADAPAKPKKKLTSGQKNAVDKAESYLEFTAFSRKGLIAQLKFDDFSTADATYAVDHIKADWNEQAEKKAKEYLDTTSFSKGALVTQLKFDKFTQSQAEHGVEVAY